MEKDSTALEKLSYAWDTMSHEYDTNKYKNIVFNYMRNVSLQYLGQYFTGGMNILELGCGTGDEAIHLAKRDIHVFGTDISGKMVKYSNDKAAKLNLDQLCSFSQIPIEKINEIKDVFDGAFSSFGPLNCVSDIEGFQHNINDKIKSGGFFIVSVMNRYSIAEILYYTLKLKFTIARRRLGKKPLLVQPKDNPYAFECRYYSPQKFYRMFEAKFELVEYIALPLFLLPLERLEYYLAKHQKLFHAILFFDKIFRNKPMFRSLGDHFLMVLRKRHTIINKN